jgi:hypothetical protein
MIRFHALCRTPALLLSGLLIAATPAVQAQSPPAKNNTKPAVAKPAPTAASAVNEGRTLGGGTGRGKPLMTRDELRACINQQKQLAKDRHETEAERNAVEADKASLLAEQAAHQSDLAKVEAARKTITEMNERYKAHAERVAAFNERTEAVKALTGLHAERELKSLATERADLQKSQAELEAARAVMPDTNEVFSRFNARGKALEARAVAWNQRNEALTLRVRAVNNGREVWLSDCADRRYREDDEIAIQRGQ